ncbi:MAG: 4Fe-4S binding protein [Chloroflexia bacterium]|nr:4Fe-4S binding protein [Chloroflexia bacterium]
MSTSRRSFLKTLGVAGATLTVGKLFAKTPKKEDKTEFYGFLYDSTLCKGCMGCEYDCAEVNGLPEPEGSAKKGPLRTTTEYRRTVINRYDETSKGKMFIKNQCMHCNEPACASACLTKAMYKTEEGPVIWREDKCMGCRSCMIACPFDMPKFEYSSTNPIIQKCTMCFEKAIKAGETPICAYNCPEEALIFGKRRDLLKEARKRIAENPETYVDHIYGETEAGGTGVIMLASVPFEELGLRTDLETSPYPELNKTFLFSDPMIFVLGPAFLLGLRNAVIERMKNEKNELL